MTPEEAYAKYKIGDLTSEEITDLSNQWLEEGLYSFNLAEIIFEEHPYRELIGSYFEKAIEDIGVKPLTKIQAGHWLIKFYLEQIVKSEIDPERGASYLYWKVHHEFMDEYPDTQYVGDNFGLEHIFCWLREIWDCDDGDMILYHTDLPREQARVKFCEHLVEEAEKYLKSGQNQRVDLTR